MMRLKTSSGNQFKCNKGICALHDRTVQMVPSLSEVGYLWVSLALAWLSGELNIRLMHRVNDGIQVSRIQGPICIPIIVPHLLLCWEMMG